MPTAALLIIGNEILSGRTQDTNLNYLGKQFAVMGITFKEARVVQDIEGEIITAVNALRATYDYVFTTGGIGPTHDDITTACIAKAFGLNVVKDAEAFRRLEKHYAGTTQPFNEARQKMAYIPEGATLIDNPISAAPGFQIGNVYVMAGVPVIMKAMFDFIRPTLKEGAPMLSSAITTTLTEGTIATALGDIQTRHTAVEIGSYPHIRDGKLGVCLVVRGIAEPEIEAAAKDIRALIRAQGGAIVTE